MHHTHFCLAHSITVNEPSCPRLYPPTQANRHAYKNVYNDTETLTDTHRHTHTHAQRPTRERERERGGGGGQKDNRQTDREGRERGAG